MHEEVWCVWTSLLLLSNDSFRLKRHDNQPINQSPIFPISTVYKKENPKKEAQSKRPELTPHLHTLITTFTHSLTLPACTADWEELWSVQLKHQPVWIPLRWRLRFVMWLDLSRRRLSFLWFSSQKSSQCLCGDFLTRSWNLSSLLAVATGKLKTPACFGHQQTVFYCQEI